jgi:hypothetical protein
MPLKRRIAMRPLHTLCMGTGAILLSSCSDPMGPKIDKLRDALARAEVTLSQSVATGEASVTGGKAIRARLLVRSAPEYSVGALGSGILHDIRLDIVSGAVIISRALGAADDPCPGSIPLAQAIVIAEAHMGGSAVSVQPDDDDRCLREIQVLNAENLWEVKLSREGRLLEVEVSDDDEG